MRERSGATEAPTRCARSCIATRSAARQEASPQIMRRSIRIAAGPQTAKYARRIADDPQGYHRFRQARQAANRCHASEAPRGIMAHRAPPTPWWWFHYTRTIKRCRRPACTVRPSFKTGGVDATGLEEPLSLIEQGLIDTSCAYFETIRTQRHSRGVPCVQGA